MDRTAEEPRDILRESINILKQSPKIFILITLTFIVPLSIAILVHSLYFESLLNLVPIRHQPHQWAKFYIIQFFYIVILFIFSLLSTAAVVFTFASSYTSKPVSFTSTLTAIPRVFKRLFITFLYASLLMIIYNAVFLGCLIGFIMSINADDSTFLYISFVDLFFLFNVHIHVTAIWHLASVVSVLESVYGLAAMKRSKKLLVGNTEPATALVFLYMIICAVIVSIFRSVVMHGSTHRFLFRILAGGFLIVVLVVFNFIGLLTQCIVYYICKSYHREKIDKGALHEHLGSYLGEYVLLQSSIEMGNVNI
ncbi:hypothetical protein IFM89_037442 [Coptis chinensis]|uniref:Uncharacterized protein n=1 Tax=Coptis chinensis TaxID=261450 RepID=A0A835HS79_9MAGN|nr:hypothetical protein IFM89_037442 [Coptis chinensis]